MERARLLAIAALAVLAVLAGCSGGSSPDDAQLQVVWESDTQRELTGNHHSAVAGRVEGRGLVFAPISGEGDTDNCALVALSATDGRALWNRTVTPSACTLHSVADPSLADYDADGDPEVLAATTERQVYAFDPLSGDREFRHPLPAYGYTRPIVANLTGDDAAELVVVDSGGHVLVLTPGGRELWRARLGAYTWGEPAVADLDGDGGNELAVGIEGGRVVAFESDGTRAWSVSPFDSSVTWQTAGQIDDDPAIEVVVATTVPGRVAAIDGASGDVEWSQSVGNYAAVDAVGDADGDGDAEVYVGANGTVSALAGSDGTVEWSTPFTDSDEAVTSPPVFANATADDDRELLVASADGTVALVDPLTGAVIDDHRREGSVFTHPGVADTDGDGLDEAYLLYGDGVVLAFEARSTDRDR